jgi:hypothetical protein
VELKWLGEAVSGLKEAGGAKEIKTGIGVSSCKASGKSCMHVYMDAWAEASSPSQVVDYGEAVAKTGVNPGDN